MLKHVDFNEVKKVLEYAECRGRNEETQIDERYRSLLKQCEMKGYVGTDGRCLVNKGVIALAVLRTLETDLDEHPI